MYETSAADVVVVGGGPGGYAAALRASTRGLSVVVVEERQVGGTCLHRGCVPSKAMLHVAQLMDDAVTAADSGLRLVVEGVDGPQLSRYRDGVVARLYRGLDALLRSRGIEVLQGRGTLAGDGTVVVQGAHARTVRASNVVVATGSRAAHPRGVGVDGEVVLDSDSALRLDRVPGRAVIVGGGSVGVEFASMWNSFGAEVTLVETADHLLPLEDPDISSYLERAMTRRGIEVRLGSFVEEVQLLGDVARVAVTGGKETIADTVLVATGRTPNTSGVGLEDLGVLDERGFVRVDRCGRTVHEGIWAVGDVIGPPALAHAAFSEGFRAADCIAGVLDERIEPAAVPHVVYGRPEIASVGLTEPEARALFPHVEVTRSSISANSMAAISANDGVVKIVTGSEGETLGVHIASPHASDLIAEAAVAVTWRAQADEMAEIVHAHPSLSEAVREAFLGAAGLPFHQVGTERAASASAAVV